MAKIFNEHMFTLQWHCTARCQQKCSHCYMYDEPTYKNEIENELATEECIAVINDFADFCGIMNIKAQISFTGGDPLLRSDLFNIISHAKEKGMSVGILGNPFLLNNDSVKALKEVGVDKYQLSLDGMKETHDRLRMKGSFDSTVSAVNLLKDNDISVGIMMTLSRDNINDLFPLMEYVGKIGADAFAFARITAVGAGKQYHSLPIGADEYRELLIKTKEKIQELKNNGVKTRYRKKCHLWKLLDYENGDLSLTDDKETIFGGCTLGVTGLIILADGTVMGCRRFPSIVGQVPKQSIYDIFLNSKEMDEYRNYSKLEKCSKCELLQICRGCQAVAYGQYGKRTAPDPQCWKQI